MKKSVNTLLAVFLLAPSVALCAATGDSSIPTKATPTTSDKVTIGDADDVNSTTGKLKSKDITLGSLPVSTATQSALNGKANISAFASQSAFTSAWGWTPGGGVSAWSDVQALISGTGDYIKYDGTRGTPAGSTYTAGTGIDITSGVISSTVTGTLPSATEGQGVQKGATAWEAVDLAPLAFTDNVSRNSSTGVVSVPVTATATSGSAVPFTSGGAYTALGGKQDADADLTTAAGATGAGNSKYFGTNSSGTAGFYDLPSGSGSFTFDTFPEYEDSAHSSGIAVNGTTLAVYSSIAGKWLTVGLTDSLNPTLITYSLTITPSGFTGADKFTYNSIDYTAQQEFSGLNADASFTVTPDTGRAITCTGTGLTDNTGGSYTANTDTASVTANCTSSVISETQEIINPTSAALSSWSKVGSAADNVATITDSDDTTYLTTASTSATINMGMSDTAASTISSVKMCARVRVAASGTHGARFRIFNGTTLQSFSPDPVNITSTEWTDVCTSEMTTNPYTSSAWTASALNSLNFYLTSNSVSATPNPNVSKVWGIVKY